MDITFILVGLLLIILGFLVKAFPNLIAGYNTMSKEQKKNVDIKGLSNFMRNSFILIGLLVILGHYLIERLGWIKYETFIMAIVLLCSSFLMVIFAQKFDKNGKKK